MNPGSGIVITIVGLGPGEAGMLTRDAWEALTGAAVIYLRTQRHPAVAGLPQGVAVQTCDDIYEDTADLSAVYPLIAARIIAAAEEAGSVVYAVPGDPHTAEASVELVRAEAGKRGWGVRVLPGVSFVQPVMALLGRDVLPSLQLCDALALLDLHHPPVSPDVPVLLAQVYSRAVASELKLTLMNQYPEEHLVALVHAAGTTSAQLEWQPLHAIDHSLHIGHLTCLFVPALPVGSSFAALEVTVAHLRSPAGCAWDREQTHQSLRATLLEETYEVLAALDAADPDALQEELGDLLLQVVLHAQIAVDDGEFQMHAVLRGINEKLVRRHPHVYGTLKLPSAEAVVQHWETIKAEERRTSGVSVPSSVLAGVPRALPALAQAQALQARAARVGFDWPAVEPVLAKVMEELGEVQSAAGETQQFEELGDLLLSVVNWARHLKVDAETALRVAAARFRARFELVEQAARELGRSPSEMTLAELDTLWDQAKVTYRVAAAAERDDAAPASEAGAH